MTALEIGSGARRLHVTDTPLRQKARDVRANGVLARPAPQPGFASAG
jgi:hypothetical protein